jgi:hypothetical protein
MNKANTEIESHWQLLLEDLYTTFGKKPADLNAVLFLVGVQELGLGPKTFTKEQKQDLMHIAVCRVLSVSGYYKLEGHDADGWPHWQSLKPLPFLNLKEQEQVLKQHVIEYFKTEIFT